jgi:hypothetical protein
MYRRMVVPPGPHLKRTAGRGSRSSHRAKLRGDGWIKSERVAFNLLDKVS